MSNDFRQDENELLNDVELDVDPDVMMQWLKQNFGVVSRAKQTSGATQDNEQLYDEPLKPTLDGNEFDNDLQALPGNSQITKGADNLGDNESLYGKNIETIGGDNEDLYDKPIGTTVGGDMDDDLYALPLDGNATKGAIKYDEEDNNVLDISSMDIPPPPAPSFDPAVMLQGLTAQIEHLQQRLEALGNRAESDESRAEKFSNVMDFNSEQERFSAWAQLADSFNISGTWGRGSGQSEWDMLENQYLGPFVKLVRDLWCDGVVPFWEQFGELHG